MASLLGKRESAERLASALETAVQKMERYISSDPTEKKMMIKNDIREDLRGELVTRELLEERFRSLQTEMAEKFNVVDERFRSVQKEMGEKFNVVDREIQVLR